MKTGNAVQGNVSTLRRMTRVKGSLSVQDAEDRKRQNTLGRRLVLIVAPVL